MPDESPAVWLVLMKGFPATGKSELAYALARRLRWPLVDKDDIKDVILSCPDSNRLSYEAMWNVAGRQLRLGVSVIVDSPLTYPVAFTTATALAERYGARVLVVETQLEERLWQQRLEERDASASTHKIASWQDMQNMLAAYDGCWRYPIPDAMHMPVDASLPVTELMERVLSRLGHPERNLTHTP